LGYLDTNVVEHIHTLGAGVDDRLVGELRAAIDDGQVLVPYSDGVALELVALAEKDVRRAADLGRAYYGLVSKHVAFRAPRPALRQALEAGLGGSAAEPLMAITRAARQRMKARLCGKAAAARAVARIAEESRVTIQDWLDDAVGFAAAARGLIGRVQSRPLAEVMPELWREGEIAATWAMDIAEDNGFIARAREAGSTGTDLLKIPGIAAAVGIMVGLAYAQAANGRKPDHGDFRDAQHGMLAASAGAVLVTHDARLGKLIDAIPGRPLVAMDLRQFIRQL
jgi:hypothetical protein